MPVALRLKHDPLRKLAVLALLNLRALQHLLLRHEGVPTKDILPHLCVVREVPAEEGAVREPDVGRGVGLLQHLLPLLRGIHDGFAEFVFSEMYAVFQMFYVYEGWVLIAIFIFLSILI